jgi:hypothetical protein
MLRVLGEELAVAVQRFHQAAGIRFITGQAVTGATGLRGGAAGGLVLGDGTQVPAGVIVEATGSLACVEWLADAAAGGALDVSDGVLCDNTLAAVPAGSGAGNVPVVAVGDVARFPNPLLDEVPRRVEHWAMPPQTARRAAATLHSLLTGSPADAAPFTPVPEFWSDQLELRMQSYGMPGVADEARVTEGDPGRLTDGVVAVYHRDGRHVGTVAVNIPVARHRELREELVIAAM